MGNMTPRECVLAALDRKPPDRIPFELSFGAFTPALMDAFVVKTGATDPAEYWNFPSRSVGLRGEPGHVLWRRYAAYYPAELPVGAGISGLGTVGIPGSLHHFGRSLHPLKEIDSVEQVLAYPFPDPHDPARYAHLKNEVAALHARGFAAQGELYCTLFESAWAIRGLENTLLDFLVHPDIIEALLDRLTALRVVQARQLTEAGIDLLRLGDDISGQSGMLMNPDLWRQWLKPRLARVIAAARAVNPHLHVFYHSDGDCRPIVSDLIEVGVTVLNPVQPECMDLLELQQHYGDRLAFWGTIGTQTTMPFGTPDEVKGVVRDRIESIGRDGGLVLAPTHILEPEVPWENVIAFIDAVREYGGT